MPNSGPCCQHEQRITLLLCLTYMIQWGGVRKCRVEFGHALNSVLIHLNKQLISALEHRQLGLIGTRDVENTAMATTTDSLSRASPKQLVICTWGSSAGLSDGQSCSAEVTGQNTHIGHTATPVEQPRAYSSLAAPVRVCHYCTSGRNSSRTGYPVWIIVCRVCLSESSPHWTQWPGQ